MKKLCMISMVMLMAVAAQALPTKMFAGEFGEEFGSGGAGSPGGYIDAIDTFWSIDRAYSQGATLFSAGTPASGDEVYLTEYTSGAGSNVWVKQDSIDYNFDNFSLWVTAYKATDKFTFTLSGINAAGDTITINDGFGEINPDGAASLIGKDWSAYDQWGPLAGHLTINQVPAPGALLLGSLGMGLVGWLRRRQAV